MQLGDILALTAIALSVLAIGASVWAIRGVAKAAQAAGESDQAEEFAEEISGEPDDRYSRALFGGMPRGKRRDQ